MPSRRFLSGAHGDRQASRETGPIRVMFLGVQPLAFSNSAAFLISNWRRSGASPTVTTSPPGQRTKAVVSAKVQTSRSSRSRRTSVMAPDGPGHEIAALRRGLLKEHATCLLHHVADERCAVMRVWRELGQAFVSKTGQPCGVALIVHDWRRSRERSMYRSPRRNLRLRRTNPRSPCRSSPRG